MSRRDRGFIICYEENQEDMALLLAKKLNEKKLCIMKFFRLRDCNHLKIFVYTDLDKYKNHLTQNAIEYKEWMIADTYDGRIHILSLDICRKTISHKDMSEDEYGKILVHEFIHYCQQQVNANSYGCEWFWEALALNLAEQKMKETSVICTKDELMFHYNELPNAYNISYSLGKYLLDTTQPEEMYSYIIYPDYLWQKTEEILKSYEQAQKMDKEYLKSMKFWDEWLKGEVEQEKTDEVPPYMEIGSKDLAEAAASLATQKKVLDYGCGSGWASVILQKNGCPCVKAVDVSENGILATQKYAELFGVLDKIDYKVISQDWLLTEDMEEYDGLFCSNVLDVVPKNICNKIVKGAARVCKKGAKLVIGLNPYFQKEDLEKRNMVEIYSNHYTLDGILRLVNHTDEEWKKIFEPYFLVESLKYFKWDGEDETVRRRLFYLKRK